LLKDVFESTISVTDQDVVLVFVSVFTRKVYAVDDGLRWLLAIQLTTAAGICAPGS
jgi:hypothetical protein